MDAGTFVSAFEDSTYEDYIVNNDFQRYSRLRALIDYEDTLPKADDELIGEDAFANDPNFGS